MPDVLDIIAPRTSRRFPRRAVDSNLEQAPAVCDAKELYLQSVRFLSRENVQTNWPRIVLQNVAIGSEPEGAFRHFGRGATHSEFAPREFRWFEGSIEQREDEDWFQFSTGTGETVEVDVKPDAELIPHVSVFNSTERAIESEHQPNALRAIRVFSAGGQRAVVQFWRRLEKKQLSHEAIRAVVEAFEEAIEPEPAQQATSVASKRANSFVNRAQRLESHGQIDAALDMIYDSVDELMRNGEFARLDSILESILITELSVDILLGVLTATLPARNRVPSRSKLFGEIDLLLKERGEFEEGLLTGLEG